MPLTAGGFVPLRPDSPYPRWRWLDSPYAQNRHRGGISATPLYAKRRGGVLALASVHGIAHYSGPNEDDYKKPDIFTGGLAELVAELTPCSVVCNRKRVQSINPHAGETLIEQQLKSWHGQGLKYMLDLHGAKTDCGFDVAIGTGQAPNPTQQMLIERIMDYAAQQGLDVALNPQNYAAKGRVTLTRRMLDVGLDGVVQLEVCRTHRNPFAGDVKSLKLVTFLKDLCQEVNTLNPK